MNLPSWFRTAWWGLLLALATWVVYARISVIRDGEGTQIDIFVLLVWTALALVPVFGEIRIFGVKLKAQVAEIKKTVHEEVGALRAEIRTSAEVRNDVSSHIYLPSPASDELLKVIRAEIDSRIPVTTPPNEEDFVVDEDTQLLFAARYNLERELRRVGEHRFEVSTVMRHPPRSLPIARALADYRLIEQDIAGAIREIFAVCSKAIHGSPATKEQIAFVRDVHPRVMAALKTLNV